MQMGIHKQPAGGFTLVELVVVSLVAVMLIGMLLPALAPARSKSSRIKCVNNLKSIGLSFRIFATDHQDHFPMEISTKQGGSLEFLGGPASRHFVVMSNELATPAVIVCPDDPMRRAARSFSAVRETNVSYFVGLRATLDKPQDILAGDRNLTTNGVPVSPGVVELTTNVVVGWSSEIPHGVGSVAMADGSVQQWPLRRLADLLRGTDHAPVRLAVP